MAESINLAGFENTQDLTLTNILLENFILRYDWGFADKGGFYNIKIPSSGMYGGEKSKLVSVKDNNFQDGKVWQANRSNWVWENDLTKGTPIPISGVFVNNSFVSSGYNVDYKNGRVVFNNPIGIASNVRIEYSSKYLSVVPAKGVPWIRKIQTLSNRVDSSQFTTRASGEWAVLGQSRVQLPALIIDVLPPKDTKPYQLGGGKWIHNDIMFYIIAQNDWQVNNIIDQIVAQDDTNIKLFNPNKAISSGVYPFDASNFLRPNALASGTYPKLVANFEYKDCFIFNTGRPEMVELNSDLYLGSIRCTTEVRDI